MEEKDIYEVLRIIVSALEEKNFIWRLEGSANLKIQKVDVIVRDLDITTNDEGLHIFRDALKDFVVKDFFNEKIEAKSLVCDINGFEVEINSDHSGRNLGMFDKIEIIEWKGLTIPILPLKYAKEFYEMIGRQEKADLIEKYLTK